MEPKEKTHGWDPRSPDPGPGPQGTWPGPRPCPKRPRAQSCLAFLASVASLASRLGLRNLTRLPWLLWLGQVPLKRGHSSRRLPRTTIRPLLPTRPDRFFLASRAAWLGETCQCQCKQKSPGSVWLSGGRQEAPRSCPQPPGTPAVALDRIYPL